MNMDRHGKEPGRTLQGLFSKPVVTIMWLLMELVAMATDLAGNIPRRGAIFA
jgi:Mn2+/Fe2+ NRAMP family transporter